MMSFPMCLCRSNQIIASVSDSLQGRSSPWSHNDAAPSLFGYANKQTREKTKLGTRSSLTCTTTPHCSTLSQTKPFPPHPHSPHQQQLPLHSIFLQIHHHRKSRRNLFDDDRNGGWRGSRFHRRRGRGSIRPLLIGIKGEGEGESSTNNEGKGGIHMISMDFRR